MSGGVLAPRRGVTMASAQGTLGDTFPKAFSALKQVFEIIYESRATWPWSGVLLLCRGRRPEEPWEAHAAAFWGSSRREAR